MEKNKGSALIIVILVVVVLGAGFFFYKNQQGSSDNKVVKDSTSSVNNSDTPVSESSSGKVLAGKSAQYKEFTQAEYKDALASGKTIFLDFYANWCPICRAEAPEIHAGFDALTTDQLVGFRVNFNDSDTDEAEKALAEQFEVPYQHYKVILQGGKAVFTSPDQWDREIFATEVGKFVN